MGKSKAKRTEVVHDSFSIFYDTDKSSNKDTGNNNTARLLPARPPTNDNKYVYPVTAFPSRSKFEVSREFPALILPAKRTHQIRNQLKSIMVSRPRLSVVHELSDNDLDHDKDDDGIDDKDNNDDAKPKLKLSQNNRKEYRKIVLHPQRAGLVVAAAAASTNSESGEVATNKNTIEAASILQSLLKDEPQSFRVGTHTITLSYDDWTAEELLKRLLLPEGISEIPSSFEAIGHLAHLNLREQVLPYKYLIGRVLLEKNTPRITTVCNKLGSIGDSKYRTFGMEVIAGGDHETATEDGGNSSWSDVLVKEEGCEYELDFRRVYWNSRLGGEHRRLVEFIKKDAMARAQQQDKQQQSSSVLVVADLMAGIGPFAIPLTAKNLIHNNNNGNTANNKQKKKKKNNDNNIGDENSSEKIPLPLPIEVYANDLNPSSYEFLVKNAKRNKCENFETNKDATNNFGVDKEDKQKQHKLCVSNMDGRAYCHRLQDSAVRPDHFIMNLPASALEFLDCFRGYPNDNGDDSAMPMPMPRIHVHCFASKDPQNSRSEIRERAETALGCALDETRDGVVVHTVRDVAPSKNMYCLSFLLPRAACALPRIQPQTQTLRINEEENKRERINDEDGELGSETDSKKQKMDE